ncbi:site-specific DNA-methyltransferase [Anaerophaga thermohalophila]|uniref:site-specific DNA-methyltransferase n=1 Tax=Anaerophaga thermohalophila TaxID=177400 RepID=UPI0002FEFE3F|nr:site-specific DNA-methyltransferase [Anaerophaga thermohalophila]
MDGKSLDIQQTQLEKLKELFPEVISEGKVDWEKLKATLGEDITFSNERYVLNWAGKSDAFKVLQSPTTATLTPAKDESVNFDDTGHIFIEGENLEVLKVLQKSYYGKVKMIYIDPPYNTGNDHFIYPDRFSESKEDYLKRVGEKDEEGYLTREGMYRKNSRDSGHYHSNWLSMMYPRLFLARNLLKDDGVIFVSIDDNEVHNLRLLMNEIFGEENFLGTIIWKKKTNGNNMGNIPPVHDYIIAYGKQVSNEEMLLGFPLSDEYLKKTYTNPDNDKRGPWTTSDLSANHIGPHFPITNPETGETYFPPKGRYWVFNEKEVEKRIKDGRIIFGKSGQARPVQKVYLKERKSLRVKPESWWDKHGLNEDGTKEMADLFSPKIFVHSKPSILVKNIVNISTKDEDIILDFFSGSGTTGHATIELNKEDGGKRKFICIQLQEETDEKSEAFKAGYKTIADLAKERIRRVIKKIENEQEAQKQAKAGKLDFGDEKEVPKLDLGFKVFKLQSSNFKIWRGNKFENGEQLEKQLDAFTDPVKEGSEEENMLYELLLKSGFDLNSRVANKGSYYVINGNEMAVVLTKMSEAIVNEIISLKPQKCIALDKLFAGNDQLKTNTVLQMRDAGIDFKTI